MRSFVAYYLYIKTNLIKLQCFMVQKQKKPVSDIFYKAFNF